MRSHDQCRWGGVGCGDHATDGSRFCPSHASKLADIRAKLEEETNFARKSMRARNKLLDLSIDDPDQPDDA